MGQGGGGAPHLGPRQPPRSGRSSPRPSPRALGGPASAGSCGCGWRGGREDGDRGALREGPLRLRAGQLPGRIRRPRSPDHQPLRRHPGRRPLGDGSNRRTLGRRNSSNPGGEQGVQRNGGRPKRHLPARERFLSGVLAAPPDPLRRLGLPARVHLSLGRKFDSRRLGRLLRRSRGPRGALRLLEALRQGTNPEGRHPAGG